MKMFKIRKSTHDLGPLRNSTASVDTFMYDNNDQENDDTGDI